MTRLGTSQRRLPLTIAVDLPTGWSDEQAMAVVELLDQLREKIWTHYDVRLNEAYRKDRAVSPPCKKASSALDDPPFCVLLLNILRKHRGA